MLYKRIYLLASLNPYEVRISTPFYRREKLRLNNLQKVIHTLGFKFKYDLNVL